MITIHNLLEHYPSIDKKDLPQILQKDYPFVSENIDLYNDDDDIKMYIDTYIQKLNEWLIKKGNMPEKGKPTKGVAPVKDIPKAEDDKSMVVVSKQKGSGKYKPFNLSKNQQGRLLSSATGIESEKQLSEVIRQLDKLSEQNPDMTYRIVTKRNTNKVIYKTGTKKTQASKPKKEPKSKIPKGKPIEKLPADVAYIKRYASMHGKQKTRQQVLSLLHSLQKAITERTLNKTMPYAKEIDMIQGELIVCYEKMGTSALIEVNTKALSHYLDIVNSFEPMLSVSYLKQYIALNGKEGIKDKAKALAGRIRKAVDTGKISKSDRYARQLEAAYGTLIAYTDKTLTISQAELNGLSGLGEQGLGFIAPIVAGVAANVLAHQFNKAIENKGTVISSTQLAGMEFETLSLTGEYKDLIGIPSKNFSAMVYGMPGSGKTTWCIRFAKYLAQYHGLKVLFATIEEGINHTAAEKLKRLQAAHVNLSIADYMPDNLSTYHVVFIDSINSFRYSTDDLRALRNSYPGIIFIYIFQVTKEGKFKGSQEYEHDVDVVIRAEDGVVSTVGSKNRFGAGASMRLW